MRHEKKADPFYGSAAWQKARRARLMMDNGLCQECMRRFEAGGSSPRPATMVHHIIPISRRPDLRLDLSNMESLCNECHERMHPDRFHRSQDYVTSRGLRVIKIKE